MNKHVDGGSKKGLNRQIPIFINEKSTREWYKRIESHAVKMNYRLGIGHGNILHQPAIRAEDFTKKKTRMEMRVQVILAFGRLFP